jgi:hypothetical protein
MLVLFALLLQNPALADDTDTDTSTDSDTGAADSDTLSETDVDYSGENASQLSGEAGGRMACATLPAATFWGLATSLLLFGAQRRRA